jgi:hypothetical protein
MGHMTRLTGPGDLAAEARAAADAQPPLRRAILLAVFPRRPDERGQDDHDADDGDDEEQDADRGGHVPHVPGVGRGKRPR